MILLTWWRLWWRCDENNNCDYDKKCNDEDMMTIVILSWSRKKLVLFYNDDFCVNIGLLVCGR